MRHLYLTCEIFSTKKLIGWHDFLRHLIGRSRGTLQCGQVPSNVDLLSRGTLQCGQVPSNVDLPSRGTLQCANCSHWKVPVYIGGYLWDLPSVPGTSARCSSLRPSCLSMQNVKSKLVILNGTGWYLHLGRGVAGRPPGRGLNFFVKFVSIKYG